MAEKKEKAVGWGKQVTSWKRGVSVCLDDIQNYATKAKNGKFYVNLNVVDLKEPNQYGKNVSVEIDTWKPDSTRKSTTEVPRKYPTSNTPENFQDDSSELIPF